MTGTSLGDEAVLADSGRTGEHRDFSRTLLIPLDHALHGV